MLEAAIAAAALAAFSWWTLLGPVRWVVAFLMATLLLPPLPLPWGDSGPHPALAVAGLGVWAGLVRLGAWRLRLPAVAMTLLSLAAALALSVFMAAMHSGPRLALESAARIGLFSISVYLFLYLASGPGREFTAGAMVRLLFAGGSCAAAFACLDFYYQFPALARFAEQMVWLPGGVFRRAQGLFYEASTLGVFCGFLLVMIAAIAVLRLGPALRLRFGLMLAAAAVLFTALVLSFSRAAMVSLGISLCAMAWLERKHARAARRALRAAGLLVAAIAVGGVLLYLLLPEFLAAYVHRLWYSGVYLLEAPNLILSRRLENWTFLLDYLREHPWQAVLGIGYKTLPYTEHLGRPVIADNMYLSLLIETGLLGLGALFALHAAVLVSTYRWVRASQRAGEAGAQRLLGLWMFSFWCGFAVQMWSGDVLTYWRILPAIFAPLAVASRETVDDHSLS